MRYPKDDGGFGTISGFTSKTAAENKATEIEADQRRGQFLDPDGGKLTLAEWSIAWFDALDVAATTEAQYRSLVRNHILARWGATRLDAVSGWPCTPGARNSGPRATPRPPWSRSSRSCQ